MLSSSDSGCYFRTVIGVSVRRGQPYIEERTAGIGSVAGKQVQLSPALVLFFAYNLRDEENVVDAQLKAERGMILYHHPMKEHAIKCISPSKVDDMITLDGISRSLDQYFCPFGHV